MRKRQKLSNFILPDQQKSDKQTRGRSLENGWVASGLHLGPTMNCLNGKQSTVFSIVITRVNKRNQLSAIGSVCRVHEHLFPG